MILKSIDWQVSDWIDGPPESLQAGMVLWLGGTRLFRVGDDHEGELPGPHNILGYCIITATPTWEVNEPNNPAEGQENSSNPTG